MSRNKEAIAAARNPPAAPPANDHQNTGDSERNKLRRTESGWQLTVTDDGCGLPGEDVQAALENRRSFLGGAQLGLLLCRECCRRMNWRNLTTAPWKSCGSRWRTGA